MKQINPNADVRGNKKQLQAKALTMGINIKKIEDKILEGWVGKPKGMKQVAFERGFIDLDNLAYYKKDVYKDDDDKILDKSFSLSLIIASLTDFVEEKTLFQHMGALAGEKLGLSVIIDRTPKCHP